MKLSIVVSVAISALAWMSATHALPHGAHTTHKVDPAVKEEPRSLLGKRYVARLARDTQDIPAFARKPNMDFNEYTALQRNKGDKHARKKAQPNAAKIPSLSGRAEPKRRQGRAGRFENMLKSREAQTSNGEVAARDGVDDDVGVAPIAKSGSVLLNQDGESSDAPGDPPSNVPAPSPTAPEPTLDAPQRGTTSQLAQPTKTAVKSVNKGKSTARKTVPRSSQSTKSKRSRVD